MIETLLIVGILLGVTGLVMLVVLLRRSTATDLSPVLARLETWEKLQERTERTVKDEVARNRQESADHARGLREEVQGALKNSTDSLVQSVDRISAAQQQRLEDFANRLNVLKQANDAGAAQLRLELTNGLNLAKDSQDKRLSDNARQLQQQLDSFAALLTRLTESNEKKSDELRTTVDGKLKELQTDNANKLEEMRRTVDEKLQGTLDKRLGESFKLVSERLEQVHKGLGEMRTLANGVGDLKRVLTNVKTRGTWGEMQLGNLLEQILTPDQYALNVLTKPSGRESVEFAIKLPGRDEPDGKVVWLPIDAKFPKEDYERLVEASERGDAAAVEQASKDLEIRVRSQARDIRDKYIEPPHTTDFGLLYLPTEGLFAEVLRRPGLVDSVQREQRVVIVGPTTLAALLNSLQMGFRTLAIQKRSSEVWKVLGAVKTEFGKFGDILDKVKKKLDETGNTIEEAAHRSRQLERKLKKVEALPAAEATALLGDAPSADGETESPLNDQ
ncbi:MAG: DNA recombination protein RmuC [Candidatus Omnitrophica bacterium]|nr:DNA recombination protein RmuC [Candidatus Omnitrophota bacterium]